MSHHIWLIEQRIDIPGKEPDWVPVEGLGVYFSEGDADEFRKYECAHALDMYRVSRYARVQ